MATHINLEVNEETLQKAINDLELENPPTFVLNGTRDSQNVYGTYEQKRNLVTINVHRRGNGSTALTELTKRVKRTILHELRHAWQREKLSQEELVEWGLGPYHLRREERDANDWAVRSEAKYPGLVRVVRKQSGRSGLSRLAAAERSTR